MNDLPKFNLFEKNSLIVVKYKCPVCKSSAKDPSRFDHPDHIRTQGHQRGLAKLKGKKPLASAAPAVSSDVVNRLNALEEQNKMIFARLLKLERLIQSPQTRTHSDSKQKDNIKKYLTRKVPRGKSVNVDSISAQFNNVNWNTIEAAIIDLVDQEIFDITEGNSRQKVQGRYAIIIRR